VPLRGTDPAVALGTLRRWLREPDDAQADRGTGTLRRPARDQLDACRLQAAGRTIRLGDWLRAIAREHGHAELAQLLHHHVVARRAFVVSEASARDWLDGQSERHRVMLVDATLAGLARRRRGGEGGGGVG